MAPTLVFPLPPHPDNQAIGSKTFNVPTIDGSLVGPEIYDWLAQNCPDHHILEYLDDEERVQSINWRDAVRASYRAARFVRKMAGASVEEALSESERKTVIALIGASGESSEIFFYSTKFNVALRYYYRLYYFICSCVRYHARRLYTVSNISKELTSGSCSLIDQNIRHSRCGWQRRVIS